MSRGIASAGASALVLQVFFGSLRAVDEDEVEGLDLSQHGASASGFAGGGHAPEIPQTSHAMAVLSALEPNKVGR